MTTSREELEQLAQNVADLCDVWARLTGRNTMSAREILNHLCIDHEMFARDLGVARARPTIGRSSRRAASRSPTARAIVCSATASRCPSSRGSAKESRRLIVAVHDQRGKRDPRKAPKLDDCFGDKERIIQIIVVGCRDYVPFFRLRVWKRLVGTSLADPFDCNVTAKAAMREFARMQVVTSPPARRKESIN
jgi:hypothetical protein